jgi:hypothetical protein
LLRHAPAGRIEIASLFFPEVEARSAALILGSCAAGIGKGFAQGRAGNTGLVLRSTRSFRELRPADSALRTWGTKRGRRKSRSLEVKIECERVQT